MNTYAWAPGRPNVISSVREAFLTGSSPADFPAEHYERSWPDRFGADQLNDIGRRGLALTDRESPPSVRANGLDLA